MKDLFCQAQGLDFKIRIVDYGILIVDNLPLIPLRNSSAIAFGFLFQRTVIKPRQIRQRTELMNIHRLFADVENVQYMMVIHKITGVAIFAHAFTEIPIDENLVSGFLSAINSFGAGNRIQS